MKCRQVIRGRANQLPLRFTRLRQSNVWLGAGEPKHQGSRVLRWRRFGEATLAADAS